MVDDFYLPKIFATLPGLRGFLQGTPVPSEAEDYDPRKRDPQFAHASASPLYELVRRFPQVLPDR